MNARGHDVLIRPASPSGLVLLDRLTQFDVAKLERSGVPCSAKIQVEEDRFQVWLPLGSAAVSEKLRLGIAKYLGLPAPKGEKFGALAGFVNRQSGVDKERSLFVVAHEPAKQGVEAIAKWELMLKAADTLVKPKAREKSNNRSKGFSR